STGPDAAGKVTAVANDGTSFQIEAPPKERGGESSKINVKIGPKTTLVYNGVPSNGAKPTEGYTATVRMEDAGKGLASSITFAGSEGRGRVAHNTLAGTVSAISKDGKGFTLEASPRDRLNDAKTAEILFDPKTVIVISNVRKGEAK